MIPTRTFLTASWRFLAMLNFRIDPLVLQPYVPAGIELDTWQGQALISVVGLRFQDMKLLGAAAPFRDDFDAISLRFYVRRQLGAETRRGVRFIRELAARRTRAAGRLPAAATVPVTPTRSVVPPVPDVINAGIVGYAWHRAGQWNAIQLRSIGPPATPEFGSEAEFTSDRHWGYVRQRNGRTAEYEVRHPVWRVWQAGDAGLECDPARLYGAPFVEALSAQPCSAFLAAGSEVAVFRPKSIDSSIAGGAESAEPRMRVAAQDGPEG